MRSIDPPRPRPVPERWTLEDARGETSEWVLREETLIVALKQDCDGCRNFSDGALDELAQWPVVLVTKEPDALRSFEGDCHEVFAASELLEALEVRWPPFYLLVAPGPGRVLTEGVAFDPAQVASEIRSSLM